MKMSVGYMINLLYSIAVFVPPPIYNGDVLRAT